MKRFLWACAFALLLPQLLPYPAQAAVVDVNPFAPVGVKITLAVTSVTANVALNNAGVNNTIVIHNTGSTDAFVRFGADNTVASTTSDMIVPAGAYVTLDAKQNAFIAAITAASSTSLDIYPGRGNNPAFSFNRTGPITVKGAVQGDLAPLASQTTLQNATGMSFQIGNSSTERWVVDVIVIVNAPNTTMDLKVGWGTMPASATMLWGATDVGGAAIAGFGATTPATSPVALLAATATLSEGSLNGTFGYHFAGIVYGGGTAGTIQFQYAQNTSDVGNLTLKDGSYLIARKIRD